MNAYDAPMSGYERLAMYAVLAINLVFWPGLFVLATGGVS